MGARLEILVVGEDPLVRGGLAAVLLQDELFHVAAQLSTREAALAQTKPGAVVLWDLGLDGRAGVERLRDAGRFERPLVVLLPSEERALEAYALGARGLLLRDGDPARLAAVIRAVAVGEVVLDPELAERVLRPAPSLRATQEVLTPRELAVLERLAEGLSNREIARALAITEHTAKFHVNAILAKLGAETRTEAVVLAARLGLVVL